MKPEDSNSFVDKAFSAHFESWDEMSPLDPVKLLAEGVNASLSEVENRQRALLDRVLDSLPALFSFHPKDAKAPEGYFQFEASPSATKRTSILAGTNVQLPAHENADHFLRVLESKEILPLFGLQTSVEGRKMQVRFTSASPLASFELSFLAATDNKSCGIARLASLGLSTSGKSFSEIAPKAMRLTDTTDGLRRSGQIHIQFPENELPEKGKVEYTLTFELGITAPVGTFVENLVRAIHLGRTNDLLVGTLQGLAWEEMPLPANLMSVPSELLLKYPDERTATLQRIDTDILKVRRTNPAIFEQCYFYNAVHHSIIIPCGHALKKNYAGGVLVRANHIEVAPEWNCFEKLERLVPDSSTLRVEGIRPLHQLSPFVPRETEAAFLTRFYGSLRELSQRPNRNSSVQLDRLCSGMLACHPDLRVVEAEQDPDTKAITFYALVGHPSQPLALTTELKAAVENYLEAALPMDVKWSLSPFQSTVIEIQLDVQVEMEAERRGQLTAPVLATRAAAHLSQQLSPPPFGDLPCGVRLTKSALIQGLTDNLLASRVDNSHLRKNEVLGLHGLLVHGDTSEFMETVQRRAGQLLAVRPLIHVALDGNKEEPSDSMRKGAAAYV